MAETEVHPKDASSTPIAGALHLGNVLVNFETFHVTVADENVVLSFQEFELFRALAVDRDRVLSYDNLTNWLWHDIGRQYVRRLNVVVHRLRLKLAQSWPYEIVSIRGRGYGFLLSEAGPNRRGAIGG